MKIYPNPVKNTINIENSQLGESLLSVYNINGQKLLNQQIGSGKTQIDMSGFAKGVYTVKLLNNNKVEIRKIVKE